MIMCILTVFLVFLFCEIMVYGGWFFYAHHGMLSGNMPRIEDGE